MGRELLYFTSMGISLTTMFFYPLISGISENSFYLQWDSTNTLEFFLSFALISCAMSLFLYGNEQIKKPWGRTVATSAICVIPVSSLGMHLLRQSVRKEILIGWAEVLTDWTALLGTVVVVVALGWIIWAKGLHDLVRRSVLAGVLIVTPLSLVGGITLARYGFDDPVIAINSGPNTRLSELVSNKKGDTFVILFDELDYDYLYRDGHVREEYPNIKQFSSISLNYHEALAPGHSSVDSIIGLMTGKRNIKVSADDGANFRVYEVVDGTDKAVDIARDNIFLLARGRGFQTEIYGWMLPYCRMMTESLDKCRWFSLYNYSTIHRSISLIDPVLTNLMLWPRQFPFGLAKKPIYSVYQHKVVSQTFELAISRLGNKERLFRFVHFSIPHLPFVYQADGYRPAEDPFLQNDENYVRQVKYVDRIFGEFVSRLREYDRFDNSDIILLSDHGYRIMMKKGDTRRVPLIVKRAGNNIREEIVSPVRTEVILKEIVENAGDNT